MKGTKLLLAISVVGLMIAGLYGLPAGAMGGMGGDGKKGAPAGKGGAPQMVSLKAPSREVYFNLDEEVAEKIKKMNAAVVANDWKLAVGMANQMLGENKVAVQLCSAGGNLIITVRELIAINVIGWPEEARAKVSEFMLKRAENLQKTAKSVADWEILARSYPYTRPGILAHIHAAEDAFERGDLGRTRYWLERAVAIGSLSVREYPQVYAMFASSLAGTGGVDQAMKIHGELKALGAITVEVNGNKIDVAQLSKKTEAAIKFFSSVKHKAEAPAGKYFVPQKADVKLHVPAYYWVEKAFKVYKEDGERHMIEQQATVVDDILYYSNAKSLHAYDLKNKKELWMYGTAELPPHFAGKKVDGVADIAQGTMDVLILRDKFIANLHKGYSYACIAPIIRRPRLNIQGYTVGRKTLRSEERTHLYALDRQGKLLWEANSADKDDEFFLKHSAFLNIPMQQGNKLFGITVSTTKDYPWLSLVCVDANTGQLLWRNYLWSTEPPQGRNIGRRMYRFFRRENGDAPVVGDEATPVTDGRYIFISSNLGCFSAADISTGKPLWIFKYPYVKHVSKWGPYRNGDKGWLNNKPIIWRNNFIVAPNNCDEFYMVNKMNGEQIWASKRKDGYNYMLGLHGDSVIVSGKEVGAVDINTGKQKWSVDLGAKAFGRGCLYNGVIYQFTEKGLYLLNAADGKILHTKQIDDPWAEAGNVIITGGKLVVCGYNRITVYETTESEKR